MNLSSTSSLVAFVAIVFAAKFLRADEVTYFNTKFLDFIENINKAERFDSVFLLKSSKESHFDDSNFIRDITTSLNIPLILATDISSFYLKQYFNENLLIIVQFDSSDLLFQRLLEDLQHLRFCKTIFVLKNSSRNTSDLKRIFNFCWKNGMINVVAVYQDFGISSMTYYSCRNFGGFKIEEFIWRKNVSVFPDQMGDLHGQTLSVRFGGPEPAVIMSENSNKDTKIGGYVGHILQTFAKRHNAKINTWNIYNWHTSYEILELALNGTIEIAGTHQVVADEALKWFSYPYLVIHWGMMVPVESNIPIYKVFAFVFHWEALVVTIIIFILLSVILKAAATFSRPHQNYFKVDFIFNIDCFRGILGQSITETPNASFTTKVIYLLIFLLGIIIVTSYDAFLQSFMTQPPREKMIKSFDDIQSSSLKIYTLKVDIEKWIAGFLDKENFLRND
ncbi:uncharacterized protein LOC129918102 [Episyrphus balteatus]|uniref:uncharacterized protein LOC129918102 n=1 Tax=Episyrphus balteatus TaxID=286459 RepID=UPI0024863C6A|nr:uncharacterized protein LOC129918102 [Episyrphus balteatus]